MYYIYLIGWSKLDRWYYGSKTGIDANPSTFWKSYFTSSVIVADYRQFNGEPDVIEVRKLFDDADKCRAWEAQVLHRLKADKSKRWLNRHSGYKNFSRAGKPGTFTGRKHKPDSIEKNRQAHLGKLMGDANPAKRPEVGAKISAALKGVSKPDDSDYSKWYKGKTYEDRYGVRADEVREKVRLAGLGRKMVYKNPEQRLANIKKAQRKRWARYHAERAV